MYQDIERLHTIRGHICMRQHRNGNGTHFQNKDRSMISFEHSTNMQIDWYGGQ
jgi:hypothetical protein